MHFIKRIQWGTLLYCAAAVLLPNMFLFDLYNRNRIEISAEIGHLLVFALVLGFISVGVFVFFRSIIRSYEGALLVLVPFWIFFWLFETILSLFTGTMIHEHGDHGEGEALASGVSFPILLMILSSVTLFALLRYWLRNYKGAIVAFCIIVWLLTTITEALSNQNWSQLSRLMLLVVLYGFVILLALIFRRRGIPFHKKDVAFRILSLVICVLFVFNALPLTGGHMGNFELKDGELFRTDFRVDRNLPRPDIYWLMTDGKINLVDFETLFGGSHDQFRIFLEERGFILNENAVYIATNTRYGLPGLHSPTFYDRFLEEIFATFENMPADSRVDVASTAFRNQGLRLNSDIASSSELFNSFLQAGYSTVQIAPNYPHIHARFNYFYRFNSGGRNTVSQRRPFTIAGDEPHGGDVGVSRGMRDLIELLTLDTPLSLISSYEAFEEEEDHSIVWTAIPSHTEAINALNLNLNANVPHERHLLQRLIDSQSIPGSKLTFMAIYFAHINRMYWQERGLSRRNAASRYDLYPSAYADSLQVLMAIIDVILENNPDAVIVIQADHGIHIELAHTSMQNGSLGLTVEDTARLQNSVMSAVRIPPQYGGLDEPLDPRNITRELINRFVGMNFELLPQ